MFNIFNRQGIFLKDFVCVPCTRLLPTGVHRDQKGKPWADVSPSTVSGRAATALHHWTLSQAQQRNFRPSSKDVLSGRWRSQLTLAASSHCEQRKWSQKKQEAGNVLRTRAEGQGTTQSVSAEVPREPASSGLAASPLPGKTLARHSIKELNRLNRHSVSTVSQTTFSSLMWTPDNSFQLAYN